MPARGPGERELTRFSESLRRFAPNEAPEHGVGWAIQKGRKELKAEAHGPPAWAYEKIAGFGGWFSMSGLAAYCG
jgi:hypothetical protein